MYILQADKVCKKYGTFTALNEVSINVKRGSVFGLLGPNGAGKTSLIRLINQITAPDSGNIFFNGEKLSSRHVAQMGYLPEERGLYRKMKVGEHALYLARLKGLSKQLAIKRLHEWFEKFEITTWWNKKIEELSKGMQQKIQFIVTVVHQPQFLIFDEPFSGFDPINVDLLKKEMLNLKNQGVSIIFSTHNMASVEEICDDIALIHQSQKILEGNICDIKRQNKENLFSVTYQSNENFDLQHILSDKCKVISLKEENEKNGTTAIIKIDKDMISNDLLTILLPYVELHSFSELLPNMHDIFVKYVTQNQS
jgi:ABC-2 type transport system ATP-binding protein